MVYIFIIALLVIALFLLNTMTTKSLPKTCTQKDKHQLPTGNDVLVYVLCRLPWTRKNSRSGFLPNLGKNGFIEYIIKFLTEQQSHISCSCPVQSSFAAFFRPRRLPSNKFPEITDGKRSKSVVVDLMAKKRGGKEIGSVCKM